MYLRYPPEGPPTCMHKTMGAEGFSYTSFSSESFRRRFLRQNVPQAGIGRGKDVELYTKCTEKRVTETFQFFWFHPPKCSCPGTIF